MSQLVWNQLGEKFTESSIDMVALFVKNVDGSYGPGVAWEGVTGISESPSGGDPSPLYANNTKYTTLYSAEQLNCGIEAYTYPEEFGVCDGTVEARPGVLVGQQTRRGFGLVYRTRISNDVNPDLGYKYHIVYNCKASPSQRSYVTASDSADANTFSWDISTDPETIPNLKSAPVLIIDTTKAAAADVQTFVDTIYGTATLIPTLKSPSEVLAMFNI